MASITLLLPMAMATTELTHALPCEDVCALQTTSGAERNSLRMSWVVATDSSGERRLLIRWDGA